MDNYSHLLPQARELLDLPNDERIYHLKKDQWIGYPWAKNALDRFEALLAHPTIDRMPNLLLIGRTNNGKTQILKRFVALHPASDNIGAEAISVPVLYLQAPAIPDEKRFYADILSQIFAKYSFSDAPYKLLENVKDKLKRVGVRMLIIDELNSLISGSMAKQRQFLVVLKHLSNELKIPIVAAGTEDAVRAIQTDPQLANRFPPLVLPRWAFDTDYRRLLASYEMILPLRQASNLSSKLLANSIWSQAEGTIGETVTLLKKAAEYAINSGIERIDSDVLEKCDFESPSHRKKRSLEA
ncbi:MAG: TniB family NTP-binding protein [Pseudomonadota bacterium]